MPFVALADVEEQSFDYILIGGGTASLALAARLTEDPNVKILVLEAGEDHLDDPRVYIPSHGGSQMGNPKYDWLHKTTPQEHAGGRQFSWFRGKGLGGSSAMNSGCFVPPPSSDIDGEIPLEFLRVLIYLTDWEKLGNPGWNFESYKKYLDRATSYRVTSEDKDSSSTVIRFCEDSGHGPVKISYPLVLSETEIKLQQTFLAVGIPKAKAPNAGDPHGAYFAPSTIEPETHTRSYAATAYYLPNASRSNFSVLLRAHCTRIVTRVDEEDITATGVEFTLGYSRDVHVAHAEKEVIVCAGALKSPQILELSGIGRPSVLSSIGVPVKLALDGVGENVQEHNHLPIPFQLKDNVKDETFDLLQDPEVAAKHLDLYSEGKGLFHVGLTNFLFAPLDTISLQADQIYETERAFIQRGVAYPQGLVDQYKLQMERVARKGPGCEILIVPGFFSGNSNNKPLPGKRYMSIVVLTNYPFSRGTIHCTSNDPHIDPAYDPHYFEHDIDLQTMVELIRFAMKVAQTSPFTDTLESTNSPLLGPGTPTDDQLREFVKDNMLTSYHTAGSLSMLPREKGGVVDPRLKVHGTTNIRVVDVSIVPLHFAGHAQSTAYVIGEKAADIIKGVI